MKEIEIVKDDKKDFMSVFIKSRERGEVVDFNSISLTKEESMDLANGIIDFWNDEDYKYETNKEIVVDAIGNILYEYWLKELEKESLDIFKKCMGLEYIEEISEYLVNKANEILFDDIKDIQRNVKLLEILKFLN